MSSARLVKIGDHQINVLSHGEGHRHFTCLHGLVDTLDIWKRLAPALEAARAYRPHRPARAR